MRPLRLAAGVLAGAAGLIAAGASPAAAQPPQQTPQGAATVEIVEFQGLGHMGPVTDPAQVNEAIARFLERT